MLGLCIKMSMQQCHATRVPLGSTRRPGVSGVQASLKTEKQKKKDTAFPMRKYAVKGE